MVDTKSLLLEIKDESKGEVRAIFSTFNAIDSDRDVTRPGAFADGAPVVISSYGHRTWDGELPVGLGTIRQTANEAILEGRFFLDTMAGRDTFTVVKQLGGLQEWSYGYNVTKESFGEFAGQRVRFIEEVQVFEVSPVLRGAGVGTRTLAVKHNRPPGELDAETRAWMERLAVVNTCEIVKRNLRDLEEREHARTVLMEAERHVSSWYVELAADEVPAWKRVIVDSALTKHCERLKVAPRPRLRWFRSETDGERDYLEMYGESARPGFGWPSDQLLGKAVSWAGEVWLNADALCQAAELDAITGHEVRHMAGGDEDAARAYEEMARATYWLEATR
jgi:hypothetical protein